MLGKTQLVKEFGFGFNSSKESLNTANGATDGETKVLIGNTELKKRKNNEK